MLHPGEGDSSEVALAEAQQERSGFSVLEQTPFHLFTHEPHDVAARENTEASHWGPCTPPSPPERLETL